MSTIGRNARV